MKENMSNIGNLFALSNDPVVCVENGMISYMNPPANRLFGRELLGCPENALLPEALLSIVSDSFVASSCIKGKNYTVSCSTFQGTRLYSFMLPASAENQTAVMSVSSTMRELTNSIKATSDLITTFSLKYEDPSLSQYAAILRHSSAKMKRLVNNYSLYSAFQQGVYPFNPYMVSINKICREISLELTPYIVSKNITFRYIDQTEVTASVDEALLSQMILNLLCNSLNHMNDGGTLHLELSATNSNIIITVTDNGCGIPEQVVINVFHTYSNTVDLTSGVFTAGLGLSVADAVAKLHGGMLIIESRENEGTRVMVQFPRVVDSNFRSPKPGYQMPMHENIMTELSTWLSWTDYLSE